MPRTRLLPLALAALLAVSLAPASALDESGDEPEPLVTDAVGDANGVNYQGLRGILQDPEYDTLASSDTSPASVESADLVSIWAETDHEEVIERDAEGAVTAVRHEPTALRVSFETSGPASPTFGPTLVFRLPAVINGCRAFLQAYVHGPATNPSDGAEHANIRQLDEGCPGGVTTVTDGFLLEFDDTTMSLVYPFDAPAAAGLVTPTTKLSESGDAHNRTLLVAATAPVIDEAHIDFWSFQVGSDVPADIDCTDEGTPDHQRCSAADEES